MLTWEDDLEVHALRKRGWTIAAIARHTGFDRKTVRKYLAGAQPGVGARPGPDPFEPFVDYVTARLTEDPHLWARYPVRRARTAGVRVVVSEPDPQHPQPRSAPGV
jgi:transposase